MLKRVTDNKSMHDHCAVPWSFYSDVAIFFLLDELKPETKELSCVCAKLVGRTEERQETLLGFCCSSSPHQLLLLRVTFPPSLTHSNMEPLPLLMLLLFFGRKIPPPARIRALGLEPLGSLPLLLLLLLLLLLSSLLFSSLVRTSSHRALPLTVLRRSLCGSLSCSGRLRCERLEASAPAGVGGLG
jgi:hypothetical protein